MTLCAPSLSHSLTRWLLVGLCPPGLRALPPCCSLLPVLAASSGGTSQVASTVPSSMPSTASLCSMLTSRHVG